MTMLILSVSAGAGHVRAAEALEEAAHGTGAGEVVHWDVLEFTSRLYRMAYADSYLALVNHNPALWGYLYASSDRGKVRAERAKIVQAFDRLQFARFRSAVRELAPTVVVATHFLPLMVLAPYRRRWARFPVGLVLTDFDAHHFWIQPTAERCFVGSEELAAVLAGKGIDPDRIRISGIPVRPAFARRIPRARTREALGVEGEAPVVLVMGGGSGTGAVEAAVRAILEYSGAKVLVVAGRNRALERRLGALVADSGGRLHVFGFVEEIARLMVAADLIVSKSGGLTSSECLAVGRPMLVCDPTPGQEERNCTFLIEQGAALQAKGVEALRYKLGLLLANDRRRATMARAARRAGRPEAAATIVSEMLALG